MYEVESPVALHNVQLSEAPHLVHEGLDPQQILVLDWLYEDSRVESGWLLSWSLGSIEIICLN